MKLKDIMTRNVQTVEPNTTLREAASKMKAHNVGILPVTDITGVIGVITDRDMAMRAVADGLDASQTKARDIMSPEPYYVLEDATLEEACKVMQKHKVRRLMVLNQAKNLMGIVTLTDVAVKGKDPKRSAAVLNEISRAAA
jgi:CBS domain-containing protein